MFSLFSPYSSFKKMALMSSKYPDLPEYGIRLGLDYLIETNYSKPSNVSVQRRVVSETAPLTNNLTTTDLPSALLSVLIPYQNSSSAKTVFTCSIDARWAMGTHRGGPIGDGGWTSYIQTVEIQNNRRPKNAEKNGSAWNYLPINDGTWRRVQISNDWLQTLTPPLNQSNPEWTTLSTLITDMGMDNSTGLISNWTVAGRALEHLIATLIADSMSRQGYSANHDSSLSFIDPLRMFS